MAKRRSGPPKDQPISIRTDETTITELEAIAVGIAEYGGATVSTSAMVEAAIKEYIAKRRHIVDKYLPELLKQKKLKPKK